MLRRESLSHPTGTTLDTTFFRFTSSDSTFTKISPVADIAAVGHSAEGLILASRGGVSIFDCQHSNFTCEVVDTERGTATSVALARFEAVLAPFLILQPASTVTRQKLQPPTYLLTHTNIRSRHILRRISVTITFSATPRIPAIETQG